jgi:2'-5' RNA ligase
VAGIASLAVSLQHQRCINVIAAEIPAIYTPPTQSELAAGINYFYALLPDDGARLEIVATGERFRKSHRANGLLVGANSLHLSLCPMGKPERLSQPLEPALLEAAAAVSGVGFDISLDSAMRFTARDGQFPLVLCADGQSIQAALQLRKAIAAEQLRAGLQVSGVSSYLPHVVLIEGHAIEAVEDAITPIQWKVREFVLIRSFFGHSCHEVVGRWPLACERAREAPNMLDELANMGDLPDFDDELI